MQKYLNVAEALEDLAVFIRAKRAENPATANLRVVTVGGSYPGALSAWFRREYPDLAFAAYASSPVVNSIEDFFGYDFQVYEDYKEDNFECFEQLRQATAYIQDLYDNRETNPEPWITLKYTFSYVASEMPDDEFLLFIGYIPAVYVQAGGKTSLCTPIRGKSTQEVIYYYASLGYDPTETWSKYMKDPTINYNTAGRQWMFQSCS